MFNIKTISVGLLIFLALAISLLAYTNTGKQLTRHLFRNTDARLQALYTCPEQFERLAGFSNEIRTFHLAGLTNNIDSLLSKSQDTKLAEVISTHAKEIETLEAPLNDEERIYYEVRLKRISDQREPLRKKYYQTIKNAFPELVDTCVEVLNKNIRDCEDRFPTNFSAQADCETFYNRRVFWEMFKKTSFYEKLSSDQHISLKKNYEQSFDDQLKEQVQTHDPY